MKKRSVLRENALVFVQKGVLYDVNWGVKACRLRIKSIHIGRQKHADCQFVLCEWSKR